jgi:hypothetical protein
MGINGRVRIMSERHWTEDAGDDGAIDHSRPTKSDPPTAPPRTADDYKSILRHVMYVMEEYEAYRDDASAEKLFRIIPWIREALST